MPKLGKRQKPAIIDRSSPIIKDGQASPSDRLWITNKNGVMFPLRPCTLFLIYWVGLSLNGIRQRRKSKITNL